MANLPGFIEALGDIPSVTDPALVKRKSRDMTAAFSPVMKREMADKFADAIVTPRTKEDVLRLASAAARHRMPLIARGGGTANFGQGIPLQGGAIVDMTALNKVLRVEPGKVRAEAGAILSAIDDVTRPQGWELRMHSSTKRAATLGGYVGGGHAGVGSCVYGILRDRGNILGLEVVSIEEEPKVVELRGDDVNLVHHAYGTNGLITELEMPLAPAWAWREAIVLFDEFMPAIGFAQALATSDGIIKKLISISGWPIPGMIKPLQPFVRDGKSMVLCLIAAPSYEAFEVLVAERGGTISYSGAEGEGPFGCPLYEFSWGHTRFHVNRTDPSIVAVIGLFVSDDPVADIAKSHRRFANMQGMHFEVKRFDHRLSFQGSPYFRYESDAQLAEVMQGLAEDGAMTANAHTFLVKQGGMKTVGDADIVFKRRMDPYDLMNPGKMSLEPPAEEKQGAGAALPSDGWKYQSGRAA
jgi:hypothetical protein